MLRTMLIITAMLASGCGATREVVVRQGSELFPVQVQEVEAGMDTEQVRSLLGPPQSRWNIGGELWIYYYRDKRRDSDESLTAEIHFANDGTVSEIVISKGDGGG